LNKEPSASHAKETQLLEHCGAELTEIKRVELNNKWMKLNNYAKFR